MCFHHKQLALAAWHGKAATDNAKQNGFATTSRKSPKCKKATQNKHVSFFRLPENSFLKLFQEIQVIIKKQTQIVHAIAQHRKSV